MTLSLGLLALVVGCKPDPAVPPVVPPPEEAPLDPGFVPLHRLNNTEYRNTLRDLLYVDFVPSVTFSEDPTAGGFDNVADVLTVSPLLFEQYELATDEVLGEVFAIEDEERVESIVQAEGPGPTYEGGRPVGDDEYGFDQEGALIVTANVAHDGLYQLSIVARSTSTVPPAQLRVVLDDRELGTFDVTGTADAPSVITLQADVAEGPRTFRLEFANPAENGAVRLVLDSFVYDGPLDPEVGRSPAYEALLPGCAELEGAAQDACADASIRALAARAWRRPITAEEGDWLVGVYSEARSLGLGFDPSAQLAFQTALLSPDFVFRFEQDAVGEPRPLDDYELASRLSYFLWSSMPDDELFAVAAAGALTTDEGLRDQVIRMMADPKAEALVESFAAQWLDSRGLEDVDPIAELYPSFDIALRDAMGEEIDRRAASFLLEGAPLDDLLLSTETWVNARLAEHYGVSGFDPGGDEWQLVDVGALGRQGVLTSPAWLSVTSHADRPSAVKRGEWILEELLCLELPPPPPDVEGSFEPVEDEGSIREQEEALRLQPDTTCYQCHSQMDPYGHSLGGFDAVGASRTVDELGYPIDTEVKFLDGTEADGILDVLPTLAEDPRFSSCLVEKLFVYSLGRTVRIEDGPYVGEAVDAFRGAGMDFAALAEHMALSEPFRMKGVIPESTLSASTAAR